MILECYIDYYGCHQGKGLKYIIDGPYQDMLCLGIIKKCDLHYNNKIKIDIFLEERSMNGNHDKRTTMTHDEFFNGINILGEKMQYTYPKLPNCVKLEDELT